MEHSTVIIFKPSWSQILLQKCSMVDFFIESLLQMLKANDFSRDGCRTFILQFPCQKMKPFLFAIILEKTASSWTSRQKILDLFPCSSNPQTILKPLHIQSFLTVSIPAETIFLTGLNPQIKKSLLCNFYISALQFSLLQNQHKTSFLLVLIPTQTIFFTFNLKIGNFR